MAIKEVFHPGEFIREEIKARGWTQHDLADKLNYTYSDVHNIIIGMRDIDISIAQDLMSVFGPSIEFWLRLQSEYDKYKKQIETPIH